MKLVTELLQYPKYVTEDQVYLATINCVVKNNGELVMGAGNALAYAEAYPSSKKILGDMLGGVVVNGKPIKHLFLHKRDKGYVGGLVTKAHYRDPSTLTIVENAVWELRMAAEVNSHLTYHLPYPAIGLGGLSVEEVQPLINELPDNVIVYKGK